MIPAEGTVFKARDVYATTIVRDTGQPFVWCVSKGKEHVRGDGVNKAVDSYIFADDKYARGEKLGYCELLVDLRDLEVVPEDEVPDAVWAKLALLRLTGDAS